MRSPFLPLLKAQRDRIRSVTGREVYDDLPQNASMPYIVAGEIEGREWSDKFQPGQEVTSSIHVWSNYPGRKEAGEIMDEILSALTSSPLTLEGGFRAIVSALELSEIIVDIDGVTRHGILRMRYLISEEV